LAALQQLVLRQAADLLAQRASDEKHYSKNYIGERTVRNSTFMTHPTLRLSSSFGAQDYFRKFMLRCKTAEAFSYTIQTSHTKPATTGIRALTAACSAAALTPRVQQ